MTAADLFAGELTMAGGETVPAPPEMLEAIAEACPERRSEETEAFARRFVAALFARDLLLVPRGRPDRSKETVGIDAYSLVCSQKHALQHTLALVGAQIIPGEDRDELHAAFEGVVNALLEGAPPGIDLARVDDRLRQLRWLALGIEVAAPALDIAERPAASVSPPPPPPDRDNVRGSGPVLTRRQWWGLAVFTLAAGAVAPWLFA